jgi:glycosyltransferase involved in cell wall biosynthesis
MLVEGGFSNVVLIPPAVDTDTFHPSTARKAADHPFTVGYVGRLVPEKGVDILLRAASHVDPLPKVLIVGDGPERLHLEILAQQLDLQRVVHWRGKTAHSNVPTSLRELDVLILPSRTTPTWKEQFGRVLIEAMACGIPVVGSDSGEIPNTIGLAGLTFPEGNISALASVLQRMHDDQHLALDLSARSRRRAEECFSVESVAEQYLSFFNSVCASKPLNL